MKRKSNLVLFVCITFAIIMLSISTTLALVKDDESKVGNIIKFDKVAIMGDVDGGSKLSVNIDDRNVGNTIEVIGENFGEEELYIKPAPQTREMYLRFRVYFTFGDEELDDANKHALNSFMAEDGFPMGFELYSNEDYKFAKSNSWAYLITKDSEDLLKVVTENDEPYIICNKYIMGLDLQYETQIINVIETNNLGHLQMRVEAQAVQALGIADLIIEEGEEILTSSSLSLEEQFGNATIADYERSQQDNLIFASKSGLPTKSNIPFNEWTWNEISAASNIIERALEKGFLKIETLTIPGTKIKYDEIVKNKSTITIDNVKIKYTTTGTYGKSGYDRIFTFEERGVINKIHLKDEKILSVKLASKQSDVIMMVSNFLHDDKSNGERIGITLTSKTVITGVYKQHGYGKMQYNSYVGYYRRSTLRSYLGSEFYTAVRASIGNNIIKYAKKSALAYYHFSTGSSYTIGSTTEFYNDTIWALDRDELFSSYVSGSKWYPIYVTNSDRIKSNLNYGTRNVATYTDDNRDKQGYGYYINGSGTIDAIKGNPQYSVAFGFCV